MNAFYSYPKFVQWIVAILLLLVFVAAMGIWLKLTNINFLYYFLLFALAPIMQFTLAPIFTLMGLYKYLSPMLLVYSPNQKKYDLHNGTSFDYLFVMRKVKTGRPFQNTILAYYLEGLLKIIEELEAGKIPPSIIISGTSYFFSESTAERLGFTIVPASSNKFLKFNLYLNFIDLTWTYSLAKGKLTFPNLKATKGVTIQGEELLNRKDYIVGLHAYLKAKYFKSFPKT